MTKVKYAEIISAKKIIRDAIPHLRKNYSIIDLMKQVVKKGTNNHALLTVLSVSKCIEDIGFIMPSTTNCCGRYCQKTYHLVDQERGYWEPYTGCEVDGSKKIYQVDSGGYILNKQEISEKITKLPDSWAV